MKLPIPHDIFLYKDGFQQLEAQHGGAGIGLWMCARIVEEHAGSIRVEDPEGGGARFVVELPAVVG